MYQAVLPSSLADLYWQNMYHHSQIYANGSSPKNEFVQVNNDGIVPLLSIISFIFLRWKVNGHQRQLLLRGRWRDRPTDNSESRMVLNFHSRI